MKDPYEVKEVGFHFENCEYFRVKRKYIGDILVGGIEYQIERLGNNCIRKNWSAKKIAVEIFQEGNEEYDPYWDLTEEEKEDGWGGDGKIQSWFDRFVRFRDITSIIITYQDGHSEQYYTDYREEQEGVLGSDNLNQKSLITELGNLYLVIEEGKEIDDIFDMEVINNPVDLELKKDMYFRIEEKCDKERKKRKKKKK